MSQTQHTKELYWFFQLGLCPVPTTVGFPQRPSPLWYSYFPEASQALTTSCLLPRNMVKHLLVNGLKFGGH
ncbi:hypothetical protein AAZX31_14G107300 [Glycine max]